MVSTAIESTHAISEAGLPNSGAKPDDEGSALLAGHLGHLSEQQEEALNEFRSLVIAEDDEDSSRTPKTENPLYNDTTYLYVYKIFVCMSSPSEQTYNSLLLADDSCELESSTSPLPLHNLNSQSHGGSLTRSVHYTSTLTWPSSRTPKDM